MPLELFSGWGSLTSWMYGLAVARGQEDLYARLLSPVREAGARGQVLDVGSGPGHAAVKLARESHPIHVVGVDRSASMVAQARQLARRAHVPNVSFLPADALYLPFSEESFDLVYSIASIKHWSDRRRGLAEIHRVLKLGGSAVILEADRSADDASLLRYAERWPWLPRRLFVTAFRHVVARSSLDLTEARALIDSSPFAGGTARRLDELPLVCMRLEKAAAC